MDLKNAISVVRMTDVGLIRDSNEDSVASDLTTGLIMVADGMGGYKGGKIASEMATIAISAELAELMYGQQMAERRSQSVPQILQKAVAKANAAIFKASHEHSFCAGMGTTLVAGVFTDNKIVVGHIGDSRLYRLRAESLEQLTEDHSLLQEQINAGLITKEQAETSNDGHLVTRALGTDPEVELTLSEYNTNINDIYLLCSDGLTDLVNDEDILQTILGANGNIDIAAKNLVKLAIKHGGNDNISVVIAEVREEFLMKRSWLQKLLG